METESTKTEGKTQSTENSTTCGPGCDCGAPSAKGKAKVLVGVIVLLAACGIFVYKAVSVKPPVPVTSTAGTAFAVNQVEPQQEPVPTATTTNEPPLGKYLESLTELNKVAMNQDAVFIFIPAREGAVADDSTKDAVLSAQKILTSRNVRVGLYSLKTSAPNYSNIAAQVSPPAIMIACKGRSTGLVSGEVTETKLLQAYTMANRAGGGCCSGGSRGSSGCK